MLDTRVQRWSRYLLFFILAVLPLERIPSLDVAVAGSSFTVRLSQLAALILIAINLPTLFGRRAELLRSPWRWIWLFLLAMGLSSLLALDPKRAALVTAFTGFVVVLAWTISLRFERDQVGRYAGIILASAVVACAFGFYQFFGDVLGLPTSLTGLHERYTSRAFYLGFPRVQSTALEPLYFANYLLLPICLGAVLYLLRRSVWLWPLVLILTCLWLTVSRGAFGAVAVVLLLLVVFGFALGRAKRVVILLGVVLVTVGISLGLMALGAAVDDQPGGGGQDIDAFVEHSASTSGGTRAYTRSLAVEAFAGRPIFGVGPGNFGTYAHGRDPALGESQIVNNEPLELLAETGTLGLLCFTLFALSTLRLAVGALAKNGVREQPWVLGLLLCLIGYAAQYQTMSTLYITHVWVTIGLLLGCLFAGVVRKETHAPHAADE